jgi:hypothetical protein
VQKAKVGTVFAGSDAPRRVTHSLDPGSAIDALIWGEATHIVVISGANVSGLRM